jgi:hypothetical protein
MVFTSGRLDWGKAASGFIRPLATEIAGESLI